MKRLAVVAASALFIASFLSAQQKGLTNSSTTQTTRQILAAQADVIADLTKRSNDLERRVQTLEQREREAPPPDSSKAPRLQLHQAKLELAGFDNGCKSDQDRAFALALADGKPAQTYEGAAAMNCTERLRKIVNSVVEALENQQ